MTSPTGNSIVLVEGEEIAVDFQLTGYPNLLCGPTSQSLTRVVVTVEDPPLRSCGATASYNIPQVAVSYGNVNLGKSGKDQKYRAFTKLEMSKFTSEGH